MTESTADTMASVWLGEPGPELPAACRFDQIRDPVTIVIFGATGDLTARMLLPALAALLAGGHLPERLAVVGTGSHRPLSDDAIWERQALIAATDETAKEPSGLGRFLANADFLSDRLDYDGLKAFTALTRLSRKAGRPGRRVTARKATASVLSGHAAGTAYAEPSPKSASVRVGLGRGTFGPGMAGPGSWWKSRSASTWLRPGNPGNRAFGTPFFRTPDLPHRPLSGQGNRAEAS